MRWLSPCFSFFVSFSTIAGSSASSHAQPVPLTRDAFVERVLLAGLGTRTIEAQVAVARAEGAAAGQWQNPAIAWERSAAVSGRADTTQDELTLRLPWVLSGRLGLEREAADSHAESAELRAHWTRASLRRDALLAFDSVLAARARVAMLDDAAKAIDALGQIVAAREKAGESAGYERLRMEFEAALVADLHSAAVIERTRAESTAGALVGPTGAALPSLAGDLLSDAPGGVPSGPPVTERPDLRALALEARAEASAAEAARRRGVPDPVITAGVQLLDVSAPERGAAYVIGVEVPLPFFHSG